ncbi:hypothetical protein ABEB36_014008 [Hypothenemus hampei]|uniref:Uncharacterized protein n=1 Tax=Hypothenemus hampei TaxID=57062 RepID=A0ABD1E313_HYPHA
MPVERRGGDRRSEFYKEKQEAVINFIKKFKAIESHYCRSKSTVRKKVKAIEVLVEPVKYYEIFAESGEVFRFGEDLEDFDWKTFSIENLKPTSNWHFKFAPTKRFFMKREKNTVVINGEESYDCKINNMKTVVRTGRSLKKYRPKMIPQGTVTLKELKIRDVKNLLVKHYGNGWEGLEELQFYKNIFDTSTYERVEYECEEEDMECDLLENN